MDDRIRKCKINILYHRGMSLLHPNQMYPVRKMVESVLKYISKLIYSGLESRGIVVVLCSLYLLCLHSEEGK